jgi:pilus assembly protein TadC
MNRIVAGAGLLVWIGATLLLSRSARLSRPGLAERLRPFSPGGAARSDPVGLFSVESVRDVVGPLARLCGDRVAALFGVTEPLASRLHRVHSDMDVTAFRVRQLAVAGLTVVAAALLAAGLGWPPVAAVVVVAGAPLLAFLVPEQRLVRASERWQQDLALELPVVAEQLAMLLNAGYSLGAALARLSQRGHGSAARDLALVVNRVRQGLSEAEALREWAEVARVDAVDRLVGVLSLHTESSDLGRLVSSEARQARRDLHRRTIESIERRAQQVWVPVTVATLVPGVILLAVPFMAALRLFAGA